MPLIYIAAHLRRLSRIQARASSKPEDCPCCPHFSFNTSHPPLPPPLALLQSHDAFTTSYPPLPLARRPSSVAQNTPACRTPPPERQHRCFAQRRPLVHGVVGSLCVDAGLVDAPECLELIQSIGNVLTGSATTPTRRHPPPLLPGLSTPPPCINDYLHYQALTPRQATSCSSSVSANHAASTLRQVKSTLPLLIPFFLSYRIVLHWSYLNTLLYLPPKAFGVC